VLRQLNGPAQGRLRESAHVVELLAVEVDRLLLVTRPHRLSHQVRVLLELQHVAPHHGVERTVQVEFVDRAGHEPHVAQRPCGRSLPGHVQRHRGEVKADHLALGSDDVRDQHRDVTGARPHVQDAHPSAYAGLDHEATCHWVDHGRLRLQPAQLGRRMSQHVRTLVRHESSVSPAPGDGSQSGIGNLSA